MALPILGFDPLKIVNEIVVIGAVTTAAVLIWVNRARVLQAITGDDRIHGDCLDCVWFTVCNCCGICTGDWTRCFTRCACCPRRYRGANVVRCLGQCFGLTPYTVELKNIVCGDLPYDRNSGDFYLVVENASNPPMMSSLAEEKHPKVVHFPEVITVRLRFSPLEESLRISVRELNILGSQDLCQCRLDPMHIIDWSDSASEKIKRFEMKPIDKDIVRETPAWILLEFDHPQDQRDLENFHGNVNTVRTATRDGLYQDTPLDRFKRDYMLLDANGQAMDEVPEEDLQEMERLAHIKYSGGWCCNSLIVVFLAVYLSVRSYAASCQHQYKRLTMAYMNGTVTFPIGPVKLDRLVEHCDMVVARDGPPVGTPCRPSNNDIHGLCKTDANGGHFPKNQSRPRAFAGIARKRLKLPSTGNLTKQFHVPKPGLPCFDGVCRVRDEVVKYDMYCIVGILGLIALTCLFHFIMNTCLKEKKRQRTQKRLEFRQQMREHSQRQRQQGGARTFF